MRWRLTVALGGLTEGRRDTDDKALPLSKLFGQVDLVAGRVFDEIKIGHRVIDRHQCRASRAKSPASDRR